ncbi:MAG: 2-amino-4-hydroxy-6-hydroxymethyldihydropteridine diphosphokinase [Planctomycetes bacterium]|nr:2-amino-4-hydroxy-6-hydroxymethyldihydropteridine diphosphokinase [Planctomycetota bacterium]
MLENTAYLGLGSNLGRKKYNISKAIRLMEEAGIQILRRSRFYKTKPVGFINQPDFINAAVKIRTVFSPEQLLKLLKGIEKRMGRVRVHRWGPRIIDIDVLLYGKRIVKMRGLTIPHPRMHERAFVLQPLAQIAPGLRHPLFKVTIKKLLETIC